MKKLLSLKTPTQDPFVQQAEVQLAKLHMSLPAFVSHECQHQTVFNKRYAFDEVETVNHLAKFDVLSDVQTTDSAAEAELNPGSVMPSVAMMYWGGGDIEPEKMNRLKIINAKLERPLHIYVVSDKTEFTTGAGKKMAEHLRALNKHCKKLHIHLIPEHQVFPMRFKDVEQSKEFQTLWALAQFEGHVMGNYSHKSDLMRYMWLSKFRGVYMDWDATSDTEIGLINAYTAFVDVKRETAQLCKDLCAAGGAQLEQIKEINRLDDAYKDSLFELKMALGFLESQSEVILPDELSENLRVGAGVKRLQTSLHYHRMIDQEFYWRSKLYELTPIKGFVKACEDVIDLKRDVFDSKRFFFAHQDFKEKHGDQVIHLTLVDLATHCKGIVLMSHMPVDFYGGIKHPVELTNIMERTLSELDNPEFIFYGDDSRSAYYKRFEIVKDKIESALKRKGQSTVDLYLWTKIFKRGAG